MFQRYKTLLLCSYFILSACAFQSNEDISYHEEHYQPIHKIKSANIFTSDSHNIRYATEDENIFKQTASPIVIEKDITTQKTQSVNKHIPLVTTNPDDKSITYQIATILFDNGLSSVDPSYKEELSQISKTIKQKNAKVFIYGYASSKIGKTSLERQKKVNFEVGLKRAQNIAEILTNFNVKKNNITVVSLGDTYPLYNETMSDGERLNRRAEIYISYKQEEE